MALVRLDVEALPVNTVLLFDAYVFVDWCAAKAPKTGKDSIWIASGCWIQGHFELVTLSNPPTRDEATREVANLLRQHTQANQRVLIGFDFNYGYPTGVARALGIQEPQPWRGVWQYLSARVHDGPDNMNNRFEVAAEINRRLCPPTYGPFWGAPKNLALPNLAATKPTYPYPVGETSLAQCRVVDCHLRAKGKQPKSVWQLFYRGAVGSQALTGIPRLEQLRNDPALSPHSRVWPFETGWDALLSGRRPLVLHAEIWPGAFSMENELHSVKDAAQVLHLVKLCASRDQQDRLDEVFKRPACLTTEEDHQVRNEEGWIIMPPEE